MKILWEKENFRELRLPNISPGFNFANLGKIREIRENLYT